VKIAEEIEKAKELAQENMEQITEDLPEPVNVEATDLPNVETIPVSNLVQNGPTVAEYRAANKELERAINFPETIEQPKKFTGLKLPSQSKSNA